MSTRLIKVKPQDVYVGFYRQGDRLGDSTIVTGQVALQVDRLLIEGDAFDVRTLAIRLNLAVGNSADYYADYCIPPTASERIRAAREEG